MLSAEHEAPIALARNDPDLATQLLFDVFGLAVPAYSTARPHSADIQITVPATYHADSVLVYDDAHGRPIMAVVLEVQRRWDRGKRRAWRLYLAHVEAELDVDAALLVYCPAARVGDRYRRELADDGISLPLRPFVLTPDQIPLITEPEVAEQHPALTVLSILAHSHEADINAAFPALTAALQTVGPARWATYYDIVLSGLAGSARTDWEDYMTATPYKSQWLSKEFREAEATGWAKGEAKGLAKALLTILDSRGFDVPDDVRTRIESTTDFELLDTWLRRAITATDVGQVVDD